MEKNVEEAKEMKHKSKIEEMSHSILSSNKSWMIMSSEDAKKLVRLFDMGIINEYGDHLKENADDMR